MKVYYGQTSTSSVAWPQPKVWYALAFASSTAGVVALFAPLVVVAGIVGATSFVLLSIVNPFAGFWGYLITEYARPGEIYPALASLRLNRTVAIAVLFSLSIRWVMKRERPIWVRENTYLLFFLVAMFASVPFSVWQGGAFSTAMGFARIVIAFFLFVNVVQTETQLKRFVWGFLLVHLIPIGFQISGHHSSESAEGLERFGTAASSFVGDSNELALTISVPLAIALTWFLAEKRWLPRVVLGGLCVAYLVSIMLSGSRGGFLSLLALLVAIWLRSPRKLLALAWLALVFIGFWYYAPSAYRERILSITSYQQDESAMGRKYAWAFARKTFVDHPVFGIGAGAFPMAYWRGEGVWKAVHSMYYQLLAELGVVGVTAFILFLVSLFQRIRALSSLIKENHEHLRWYGALGTGCFNGLASFFVGSIFLSTLYYPVLYNLSALIVLLYLFMEKSVRGMSVTKQVEV
ncbi:MAG: O-antigen ligase family protein [Candidatus Caldarchaeum sp.]